MSRLRIKLRKVVRRNHRAVDLFLILFQSCLLGLYINFVTSEIYSSVPHKNLSASIRSVGWWNLCALLVLATLIFQWMALRITSSVSKTAIEASINSVLEMATRSLVYPSTVQATHMRAIVTLFDPGSRQRYTAYSFNTEPDPERFSSYSAEFGVSGRAFKARQVQVEELADPHRDAKKPADKQGVLKTIKTVIAAPMIDRREPKSPPRGVLIFDSVRTLSDLGIDEQSIRYIVQGWADLLTSLIIAIEEG